MFAWWTTFGFPGRNSSPRTYRSRSTGSGTTKMRKTSMPSACSVNGCDGDTMRSGFPSCQPSAIARRRGQIARITFDGSAVGPALNQIDVGVAETRLADESAGNRLRFPRRHETPFGGGRNQAGARPGRVIGEETERRRPGRVMAGAAVREQDRRDVLGERGIRRLAALLLRIRFAIRLKADPARRLNDRDGYRRGEREPSRTR